MDPLSSSTPPRIVEPLKQNNCCQQLALYSRSYPVSLSYWAAHHNPLRGPLAQRSGQLYKLSLTGKQGIGAPADQWRRLWGPEVFPIFSSSCKNERSKTNFPTTIIMASGSNTNNEDVNNNNVDVVPPFTLRIGGPVLMPVDDNDQPIPETDHRDGRETSPDSDDEDAVQFFSERKKGKQSQIAPGKSATTPQPNSPRVTENAALLDALRETIRTVNEQNARIRALEDGQRQILGYIKPSSPPRRAERSESPPARRAGTSQRRPVLERVQPQVQKRNRTPPREDSVARANKSGKTVALFEQRPRSPPRRKEILLGGMTQVYKGPLSRQIMDLERPRALQKAPQLGKYDGLTDPDIHIQNIDIILNYQAVRGAMAWYISLPQGSITSWKDLCKQFTSHFTASRKHPKTEANLEAVRQGPNETLRSYIERFNKEAVQVDVTDDMKKYLMRKNLRDGTKFKEMVAIKKPATWDEILYKAQAYMQFEEETMVDAMRYSRTEDNHPPCEQGNKNGGKRNGDRRGRDKSREPRGPPSQFPKSTPFKPGQDRSRYCAYHKSYGHLTEDCIQLKDAIEILIRNGKLKDYVKRKENPRQEKKREDTPDEEPRASGEKNVALAVWRPEDFYVPKHFKDTYEHPILNKWKFFPEIMVISGGVFDKHTVGSVKRKFKELITASSGMAVTLGKLKTSSQPLSFYLEELPGGSANSQIPLLVRADMPNFDVRRILVDSGSSCDIITAIADLPAIASTAHLKMKYYTDKGQVATLHGDIEAVRRCFNAAYKGQSYVGPVPEAKKSKTSSEQPETITKPPPPHPPQNVSLVDLDSRHSKQEHREEKKLRKDKKEVNAASKENLRPIPEGDFELIPLEEDPSRNLKIGKDVPDLARKQLLTVDEAASAVVQRRRRQSPEKMEAAEKALKDLLEENFISEAKYTTWLSNVILVKKSNGKWRMCVDYTDLNRACPKDAYPLPCIDRLVDNSSGFKLLSFFDAYSGYNQIPMDVADRTKTAFMTESGNYYYNVMPFGLKNAGATYQRMMNKVFRGEIGDMLEVYMNDMIVKSHEEVDHTIHLQKVFEQARKVNMRFNPEKCTFGIRAGKFFGFYLTERGIEANPDKCRAFTEFPTPNDKKSIQTLNGMLTALSRFVAKSAQHALPLFKLLRKESAFEWTEECEQALQHLKKALSEPPVLSRPDVGEVLYPRRRLRGCQRNSYTRDARRTETSLLHEQSLAGPQAQISANRKSRLVLVTAAKRLRYYFLAHTIVVRTDQPIKSLLHVPREHNKRADILSKLASTKRKNGNKSVIQEILSHPSIQKPTRVFDINAIGDANCWMTPVYNYLAHGTLPNDEKEAATVKRRVCSYTLLDNKLYRRGFSIPLLKCADEATADYILREIHEGINSQHLGGRSLARKALRAGYYWPTMQQDAKEHMKNCDKCQRHGDMHLAPPHELKSLSSPWPFAWWGMDILGPFTRGNLQCRYLIVGVDYFTKWVEAEPLPEITSFRNLRFFKRDILCRFGIPQVVVTDNGTQFTDKTFRVFLAKINTKHHFTSVEHPQTNGQAEAANRVILRGLRRQLGDAKKQWVEELPHVLWAYRTTPHSTTGETPFRLAYGTEAVIPVEIGEPSRRTEAPLDEEINDEAMREELDLVEEIRTAASLKEASLKQLVAARHDTKVIKRDFEVGSLVLRRNAKDSHEGKLASNWEGPYRVRGKTDNGAYHLETLQGKEIPRTWNAQKAPRQRMSRRHPRSSKIFMVNSELNTRAESLPDEDNSGNELHRRRAVT
ncbi:hypothetical protein TSUD_88060 [Trifolium subterraneum]|uniref:Integrase catalytic domain-containing protein n=1 Tax=Trifolium subterraneum TaxID=3900 RepID=A0A2Z6P7U3_TRISU|nr:hypothetical protein TSUD_88060 [Trifolium subterraneum]